jgi:hypothetical protein
MAFNCSRHGSTGFSPYYVLHMRDPILPLDRSLRAHQPEEETAGIEAYIDEGLQRRFDVFEEVYARLEKAQQEAQIQGNKSRRDVKFNIGDLVYYQRAHHVSGRSKKLAPRYQGPYRVLACSEGVNYVLRHAITGRPLKGEVHVSLLKPFTRSGVMGLNDFARVVAEKAGSEGQRLFALEHPGQRRNKKQEWCAETELPRRLVTEWDQHLALNNFPLTGIFDELAANDLAVESTNQGTSTAIPPSTREESRAGTRDSQQIAEGFADPDVARAPTKHKRVHKSLRRQLLVNDPPSKISNPAEHPSGTTGEPLQQASTASAKAVSSPAQGVPPVAVTRTSGRRTRPSERLRAATEGVNTESVIPISSSDRPCRKRNSPGHELSAQESARQWGA